LFNLYGGAQDVCSDMFASAHQPVTNTELSIHYTCFVCLC